MATNSTAPPVTLLRRPLNMPAETLLATVLKIDAVVSGANGLAYLVAADVLDSPLGISGGLLRSLGVTLLVFAGAVYHVGTRRPIPTKPVRLVIAANAVWAADSLLAVGAGWLTPTAAGALWVVAQAVVVAAFAALQRRALTASAASVASPAAGAPTGTR
jgi:hypothetical protein